MKLERFITPANLEAQRLLHSAPKGYGGRGDKWADTVAAMAFVGNCMTVLDYGCGQGTLKVALDEMQIEGLEVTDYDPAIEGKDSIEKHKTFDLVVCTDVLEHVEPDRLAVVIDHIQSLADKLVFLVIATRPSNKFFQDGRNVHLIIEPAVWWKPRIENPAFEFLKAPKSPMDVPSREYVALMRRLPK